MKALLLSIRTILRFRTYTAINVLGLALSLGCVFVLVRYIHQECTVNHFVPEADRTFLTAVFKEGVLCVTRDKSSVSQQIHVHSPFRSVVCDGYAYVGMLPLPCQTRKRL